MQLLDRKNESYIKQQHYINLKNINESISKMTSKSLGDHRNRNTISSIPGRGVNNGERDAISVEIGGKMSGRKYRGNVVGE